jgi:hypothetical protein
VRIAAAPRVEDVDVVQPAVTERGEDVIDAACPAVLDDPLRDRLRADATRVDLAVAAGAQDVEPGTDARPVVVLARPLVDLLRLVVEPEAVVELAIELGREP